MDLDFSEDYKVKVSMVKCTKKMFVDFPEEIKWKATTPAADHLFKVRGDGGKKLTEEQAQAFQSTMMRLLFLCKRVCPDIHTDWGKLKCILKYMQGNMYMELVLLEYSFNFME